MVETKGILLPKDCYSRGMGQKRMCFKAAFLIGFTYTHMPQLADKFTPMVNKEERSLISALHTSLMDLSAKNAQSWGNLSKPMLSHWPKLNTFFPG